MTPNAQHLGSILAWLYPAAQAAGQFAVRQDAAAQDPYIGSWSVPGVAQPSQAAVLARYPDWQASFRRPRRLYDIGQDLLALGNAQKANIVADLFAGNPPKWSTDAGPNASLFALYALSQMASLSGADVTRAKLLLAAAYCQDNPAYLVQPAFDPTINVAGDQAA